MLKQTVKTVVVMATSAVAIPYAIAILCNMMMGWPQRKDKYRRALHPKKVYALNYVVLQELAKIKYLGLMLRWKYFYATSTSDRVVKDIPYGSQNNKLDLYLPHDADGCPIGGSKPMLVFVYGGTWASGDKDMYGLLCCQLADQLKAIVCCPNYSTYPKGFVDDMVQDMVDCLAWVQQNGPQFGGDKERLILSGHSAGGHLCMLSVLELTIKRLLHHPETILLPLSNSPDITISRQSSIFSESIRFDEKHFNGSNASGTSSNDPDNGTETSFYVVDEKEGNEKSFIVLEGEKDADDNILGENVAVEEKSEEAASGDSKDPKKEVTFEIKDISPTKDGKEPEEVLRVDVTEHDGSGDSVPDINVQDSPATESKTDAASGLTQSQLEARDLLSSIRLVIGLAGIYHIADHFEHEASRGIEDVSAMARAMYGSQHFNRLSPTLIVSELPDKIRLPPILLIHGDKDKTVPLSSSLRLGQALWDKGCFDVSLSVIPGCGHKDVCLDLMDPKRPWYSSVMGQIMNAVQKCCSYNAGTAAANAPPL